MAKQKTSSSLLLTKGPVQHNYEAFPFATHECSPAAEAAMYYGFTPVHPLKPSTMDEAAKKAVSSLDSPLGNPVSDCKQFDPTARATLIKLHKNGHFADLPHPTMLFQEKVKQIRGKKDQVRQQCNLDILGVPGSIAEALIIQTSYAILEEDGFKDLEVELNSVGDQHSREAYERDLSQYVRSIMNDLPSTVREACKKNPYALFTSTEKGVQEFINDAPQAINYLTEESRTHFKEILEYLEELNIPYSINPSLVAHRSIHTQAIFRIISSSTQSGEKELIATHGMRYSTLAKRLGYRKNSPAVGAFLSYKKKISYKNSPSHSVPSPEFCFVHLGFNAKLKSLKTVDELRRKRIPTCHCLTKDKLAGQMHTADKLKLPYVIIMGQKEALEGTVMVRDTEDHSQETIPLEELPLYLKKKRKNGKK